MRRMGVESDGGKDIQKKKGLPALCWAPLSLSLESMVNVLYVLVCACVVEERERHATRHVHVAISLVYERYLLSFARSTAPN